MVFILRVLLPGYLSKKKTPTNPPSDRGKGLYFLFAFFQYFFFFAHWVM